MKNFASKFKENIMKFFETKTDNKPNDYYPKKIAGAFDNKYIEYKSEGNMKNFKPKNTLKTLDHIYMT